MPPDENMARPTIHAETAGDIAERLHMAQYPAHAGGEDVRVAPVVEALDAGDRELERLASLLDLLGTRLVPVLSPHPSAMLTAPPEDAREKAPLVEAQLRQAKALGRLNDDLGALIDRLEV